MNLVGRDLGFKEWTAEAKRDDCANKDGQRAESEQQEDLIGVAEARV